MTFPHPCDCMCRCGRVRYGRCGVQRSPVAERRSEGGLHAPKRAGPGPTYGRIKCGALTEGLAPAVRGGPPWSGDGSSASAHRSTVFLTVQGPVCLLVTHSGPTGSATHELQVLVSLAGHQSREFVHQMSRPCRRHTPETRRRVPMQRASRITCAAPRGRKWRHRRDPFAAARNTQARVRRPPPNGAELQPSTLPTGSRGPSRRPWRRQLQRRRRRPRRFPSAGTARRYDTRKLHNHKLHTDNSTTPASSTPPARRPRPYPRTTPATPPTNDAKHYAGNNAPTQRRPPDHLQPPPPDPS